MYIVIHALRFRQMNMDIIQQVVNQSSMHS